MKKPYKRDPSIGTKLGEAIKELRLNIRITEREAIISFEPLAELLARFLNCDSGTILQALNTRYPGI